MTNGEYKKALIAELEKKGFEITEGGHYTYYIVKGKNPYAIMTYRAITNWDKKKVNVMACDITVSAELEKEYKGFEKAKRLCITITAVPDDLKTDAHKTYDKAEFITWDGKSELNI